MSPSRSEKEKAAGTAQVLGALGLVGALVFFLAAIGLYAIHSFFWGLVFASIGFFSGENGFTRLAEHSEIKKTLDNFTLSPPCLLTVGDAIIIYKYRIPSNIDPDENLHLFPSQQETDNAILKIWQADPTVPLVKYEDILKIKILDIHKKPAPPPPPPPPPPPKLGKGFDT